MIGVPTVIDRMIQQAIVQVLQPMYEPLFSESSYGFRPKRSAQQAMKQALEYYNEGYAQVKEVTDQIGKEFPKEAEFQAKTARLAVLNAELDTDGEKNEQGGITQDDTPPVQGNGIKR